MIARRSFLTFVLQVSQVAALVGDNVLVTRITGPTGKGIFSLISAAATDIGLAAAFLVFRDTYFAAVSTQQFTITIAIVPMVQLTTTLSSMILGSNRPVQFAAVTLMQWVVTLAGQAVLVLAGRLDPTTALLAWLIGATVSVVVAAVLLGSDLRLALGIDRAAFRDLLGFGLKGYVGNLLQFFNYRLDSLIVNALSGIASVGIYSISVAMGEVIWYVASAFGTVMFPHVSSVDRREADRVTPIVSRNVWFITLIGVVTMALLGRWIIEFVFGTVMLAAVTPLLLLLPGILALSGAKMVLTVALDIALIPRYGIVGAAAASSIVYTNTAAALVIVFRKESGARV